MTYLVVDGHWLINVMLPPKPSLGEGREIGAYKFLHQLSLWRGKTFSDKCLVVFDKGIPSFRTQLLPGYKKSRRGKKTEKDKERSDSLNHNIRFLESVLPLCGVRLWRKEGVEGDDLLFALAQVIREDLVILSGDMDLSQLVKGGVSLRSFKDTLTEATMKTTGKSPSVPLRSGRDVVVYKALRGDSSDQISPIMRPKPFAALWEAMLLEDRDPTPQNIIYLANLLSIPLDVDKLKNNWMVVDLAMSPLAASLCVEAVGVAGASVTMDEIKFNESVAAVGMNPAVMGNIMHEFRYLK